MEYLTSVTLPTRDEEAGYLLSYPPALEMSCYTRSAYPFKIFPDKGVHTLRLSPITVFYGGNGSGKSTLLNIIAEKLSLTRQSPFNRSPAFVDYVDMADVRLAPRVRELPKESRIITSDDVFEYLLDVRALNEEADRRREELFREYFDEKENRTMEPLRSLDDYDEFRRRLEIRRTTRSKFVGRRVPKDMVGRSNGESAFVYFTRHIKEEALYLLDEPENSLSASLQAELARFLSDSVRFFGCQLILSTHSPFLLSMAGATVYDLDERPVREKPWTELSQVRAYYELFSAHGREFQ